MHQNNILQSQSKIENVLLESCRILSSQGLGNVNFLKWEVCSSTECVSYVDGLGDGLVAVPVSASKFLMLYC